MAEREELIKNYMALNHYKTTLQVKAFTLIKSIRQRNTACLMLLNLFQTRVAKTFDKIRIAESQLNNLCVDYQQYRLRVF